MSVTGAAKVPRRVAKQLILASVLFSTLITLVITAYQLYEQYQADVYEIEHRLDELQIIHLSNLATQVWVADKNEIQRQLDNLLNIPGINYLEINDDNKNRIYSGKKSDDDSIEHRYPIYFDYRGNKLRIGILYVQASLEEVYDKLIDQAWLILISNAIKTFLVIGFLFVIFDLLVSRHLRRIADFVSKISLHNLDTPLVLPGRSSNHKQADELDIVINGLNAMQDNLRDSVKALNERDSYIRYINDTIAAAIFGIDMKGNCTFVNKMCRKLLGYSESELAGKNMLDILQPKNSANPAIQYEPCELARLVSSDSQSALAQGHEAEQIFYRKDGSYIFVEYWIHPVKIPERADGYIVSFIDITERHSIQQQLALYQGHLEQLVAERTAELQQMYNELEAFSYSVSHDLRTPLRAINGFSIILKEDKSELLDEEGLALLEKVCAATDNMGSLIDSLLSLSRISRKDLLIKQVNVTRLARNICHEQLNRKNSTGYEIEIEDGISVDGDEQLTQLMLEHLISNAIKFSRHEKKQVIRISQQLTDEETVILIQDSGVGFDMKYRDQLFKPFKRLHDAMLYSGHGIGLATVDRAIRRHNGRAWAESDGASQGACFYLSFPRRT